MQSITYDGFATINNNPIIYNENYSIGYTLAGYKSSEILGWLRDGSISYAQIPNMWFNGDMHQILNFVSELDINIDSDLIDYILQEIINCDFINNPKISKSYLNYPDFMINYLGIPNHLEKYITKENHLELSMVRIYDSGIDYKYHDNFSNLIIKYNREDLAEMFLDLSDHFESIVSLLNKFDKLRENYLDKLMEHYKDESPKIKFIKQFGSNNFFRHMTHVNTDNLIYRILRYFRKVPAINNKSKVEIIQNVRFYIPWYFDENDNIIFLGAYISYINAKSVMDSHHSDVHITEMVVEYDYKGRIYLVFGLFLNPDNDMKSDYCEVCLSHDCEHYDHEVLFEYGTIIKPNARTITEYLNTKGYDKISDYLKDNALTSYVRCDAESRCYKVLLYVQDEENPVCGKKSEKYVLYSNLSK